MFNWRCLKWIEMPAMAPHSSTLAWKIPWTEELGGLQSMGLLRVGHERLHFHFSLSCIGGGNGNPLQCSCLENPRDGGAWWAAIYGVTQSWTRLKWLSSSSSSSSSHLDFFVWSLEVVLAKYKDMSVTCILVVFKVRGLKESSQRRTYRYRSQNQRTVVKD